MKYEWILTASEVCGRQELVYNTKCIHTFFCIKVFYLHVKYIFLTVHNIYGFHIDIK